MLVYQVDKMYMIIVFNLKIVSLVGLQDIEKHNIGKQ